MKKGMSREDVKERGHCIGELVDVLADRDGEIEVFPFLFGEKTAQKGSKKQDRRMG